MTKSVAIIATSSNVTLIKDGKTRPSGCWYEELAVPFLAFKQAGFDVTIYSVKGGGIPFDSGSMGGDFFNDKCKEFSNSEYAILACNTQSVAAAKTDILAKDALYMPGGHACYADFHDADLADVVATFYAAGKPIGIDCHGPTVLCNDALKKPNGEPLVKGHEVTCFTDTEEAAVGATETIPYSMQAKLGELGATWKGGADWGPHVIVSGNLITGQNPASSQAAADAVIKALS